MSQLINLTKYDKYFKGFAEDWDIFSFIHTEKSPYQVILPNEEVIYVSHLFKYNLIKAESPFVSMTSQKLDKPNYYQMKLDMPLEIPIIDYIRFIFLMCQKDYAYMKSFITFELDNINKINLLYILNAYTPTYCFSIFISIYNNLARDIFLPKLKYPSNIISIEKAPEKINTHYGMLVNLHVLEESFGITKEPDSEGVNTNIKLFGTFVKYYPYYVYKNSYFLDIEVIYDYFDLPPETDVFEAWTRDDEKTLADIQSVKTHKDIEITFYLDDDNEYPVITVSDVAKKSRINLDNILFECEKYIFNRYHIMKKIYPNIYVKKTPSSKYLLDVEATKKIFKYSYLSYNSKDNDTLYELMKQDLIVFRYERIHFDMIKEGIEEYLNIIN